MRRDWVTGPVYFQLIDIRQAIRENNYRLSLSPVQLCYGDEGIILLGITEMKIGGTVSLRCQVAWEFEDGIPAQKSGCVAKRNIYQRWRVRVP